MNEKRIPITEEIPKHKKKSAKETAPRANHKHKYIDVMLSQPYHYTDCRTGKPAVVVRPIPAEVCEECGRIKRVHLHHERFYDKVPSNGKIHYYEYVLNEYAKTLPAWESDDHFDKFAHPSENT